MRSFSMKWVIILAFFYGLGIGQAERTPKARRASVGQGIPMAGKVLASSNAPASVEDFHDTSYLVDIVLGGQQFQVLMDTGSSDLWVQPTSTQTLQFTNKTDLATYQAYGVGNVSGNIEFAQFELGGYTVPSQAFLLATSVEDVSVIEQRLGQGIMGLSFESSNFSSINYVIEHTANNPNTTVGATPIFNILSQDHSVPSSFDIQLERTSDLNDTATGTLAIGSHLAGFENVTTQPRLPRVAPGHWTVVSDNMAVNGVSFQFNQSSVPGVGSGKIAAVLDTGFSLPPLPPPAVDFIYSSIPGTASFLTGGFQVCDGYFTFLTIKGKSMEVTYCYNAYQYLTLDPREFNGFDVILGDSFLRNVYASFNYGNITAPSQDQSFVQLVSTTDLDTALPDFKTSRGKTLASLPQELSPAEFVKYAKTPNSSSSSYIQLHSLLKRYGLVFVGLLAGNIVG